MAISEIMDNDSKATLNGFLAIADKALETYSELKKHCNLKV